MRPKEGMVARSTTPLKVFISYAREDVDAAEDIEACLTACGIEVWLDEQKIVVGDSIPLRVSQGLSESNYVILLMSANSINSPWVQREWLPSLMREIDTGKTGLLTVRLDECDIPTIISDKHYADFRNSFMKGMSELINIFVDRILERLSTPDAIDSRSPGWADAIVRIINEVRRSQSVEVASLLNMLAYSKLGDLVDPDNDQLARDSPEWIHGKWMSVKGWNAGYLFTLDGGHGCSSAGGYERAVGSFHNSLRDGVVRWVKDAGDHLLLFRWYQETSGSMGGTAGDTGFGVWRVRPGFRTLNGIWWYEPISHDKLTHRAYLWKLRRIPFNKPSQR